MRRPGWIAGAVAVAMVALAAATPATAAPGQYTQYLVALPDGTPTPAGPWTGDGFSYGSLSGGSVQMIIAPGTAEGWTREVRLSPPAGLLFDAARVERQVVAPAGTALLQPQIITTWESTGDVDGVPGYAGDAGDGWLTASHPALLDIAVRCARTIGGFDPSPQCAPESWWGMRQLQLDVADGTAPVASLDGGGGALLDGSWQTVTSETAALRGSDVGSGVYRYFLRDGATTIYALANAALATCNDARPGVGGDYEFTATATSLVPCATADQAYTPTFPLTTFADGTHAGLTLGVEDASGRETVIDAALTLRINAPGGALADPGTPCTNGAYDESGTCVARPPVSSTAPALAGTPAVGGWLSSDPGVWTDGVGATFAYAWERCDAGGGSCVALAGEHGTSLLVTSAMADHTIRSVVTATTSGGSVVARSAASYAITGSGVGGGAGGAGGVRDVLAPAPGGGGGTTTARRAADAVPVPPIVVTVERPNGHGAESTARVTAERRGRDVVGRLTTARGEPIRDAQIDIVVQAATRGAHGEIAGAVTTDADGRFAFTPAGRGARIFTFGYREHLSDDHYTHWATVTVADDVIVVAPTLTVDRTRVANGRSVLFRGTATTAVELQVLTRGHWTTFATPRLRNGAFSHRYRFTRTRHTQTYRFRTLTPSGTSTTTSVRVTAKEAR